MALGWLMILFVAMSVFSIGGLWAMFLIQARKVRTAAVYGMTAWGAVIAYLGATSVPSNCVNEQAARWALAVLGILGAVVYQNASSGRLSLAGRTAVAADVIVGIGLLFGLL